MDGRISVLHSYIRTDHQSLIFITYSVPREYSKQLIWSYRGQYKQVAEEHNISLKDSSKKFTRNLFTPLPRRKYTQLSLQKQNNRENFFEVQAIPGISFAQNIEQTYNQISHQEQKSEIKIVDRWLIKVSHHIEGGGCDRWGYLSWKRSKIWEMCISTTKHGVKKLVESMDDLKRPSQLFSSTHYTTMV